MLTRIASETVLAFVSGNRREDLPLNDDLAWHETHRTAVPKPPFLLRLLPAGLRRRLVALEQSRKAEMDMLRLWTNSPHLLEDVGVVLTRHGHLPPELVPATQTVIEHVAARAPEQIVAAEMKYPAMPALAQEAAPAPEPTTAPLVLKPATV